MIKDEFWLQEIKKIYIEEVVHKLNLKRWKADEEW